MSKYLKEAIDLVRENDPFKKRFSNYRPEITDNAKCFDCDATFTVNKRELEYNPIVRCPKCRAEQDGFKAVNNTDSVMENMDTDEVVNQARTFGSEIASVKDQDEQYKLINAKMDELGITDPDLQDIFTDQAYTVALDLDEER